MIENNYNVDDKVKELEHKLASLINEIEEMKKERTIHYHIQHLEIKEAAFEQLHYHLESISIENLSRTLNIGNNFDGGVQGELHPSQSDMPKQKIPSIPLKGKVVDKTKSNKQQNIVKSYSKQKEQPQKDLVLTPKTKGYSVTFKKKEENQ
ncbi:hypothetical protein ACFVAD_03955 [Sutcliffiella sp. NPDC057660]|uniref:hypothetical protein n=1 Tax=Sutcliffiella sp. NPDC057660 TaxID=3346199 RepID=UPI0036B9A959